MSTEWISRRPKNSDMMISEKIKWLLDTVKDVKYSDLTNKALIDELRNQYPILHPGMYQPIVDRVMTAKIIEKRQQENVNSSMTSRFVPKFLKIVRRK